MRLCWQGAIGVGLAAALVAAPAFGLTLRRLTLRQVLTDARQVVRCRVQRIAPVVFRDGGIVLTRTELIVERSYLRGKPPARVVLQMVGGTAGGLRTLAPGVPRFARGAVVVLALTPADTRGVSMLVGLHQGVFDVVTGRQEPQVTSRGGLLPGPLPLSEFEALLLGVLGTRPGLPPGDDHRRLSPRCSGRSYRKGPARVGRRRGHRAKAKGAGHPAPTSRSTRGAGRTPLRLRRDTSSSKRQGQTPR